ncbi:class I SAM-dependent methyltransferase [Mongoliitalea lutea]|uniref:Methyltransferase domain-containing protein n=1 Tax=Mongoliitalea lutea TaxID=849756 RepID=A0A8J3CUP3_9BACT|nr:methyltransferase domain-containing protein [Mongoliitalea lutea]GHB23839.1 hypothetical protein GCM10008106_00560 [Mongoliitalea lutea]
MNYIHSENIHNTSSANLIIPIVNQIINPDSVLDIGCGIGTWLSVFKEYGVNEVLGVDGDYVSKSLLSKYLSEEEFISHDLNIPLNLNRKFDLALCLEVAEHISEKSSEVLVKTLINHSDIILFSAAIPGQGGQHHVNEKWPEYWQKLFLIQDFYFYDIIRPQVWNDERIEFWYKQNIFLVVRKGVYVKEFNLSSPLSIVHPDLLFFKNNELLKAHEKLGNIFSGNESLKFYFSLLKKRFFKIIKN